MLTPFHHPAVKEIKWQWMLNPAGGSVLQRMTIIPNFPIDPTRPDINKTQIDELSDALARYARQHKSPFQIVIACE